MVTLIGLGGGRKDTLTYGAYEALKNADVIVGAARLLESVPAECKGEKKSAVFAEDILKIIQDAGDKNVCVAYSGDTGFYSGTRSLVPLLDKNNIEVKIEPGISSIQCLSASLGMPWQDWNLFSAHGRYCDAVNAVMQGKPAFFLTGGELGPAELCRQLDEAGLGALHVCVGENLSYENEKITVGTAADLAGGVFDSLSVMLAEAAPKPECAASVPGIDDDLFIRGKVPMTKQDVRSAIIGRLSLEKTDTVWDVGAGTGSVSVEMAKIADMGRTYAVETEPEGCELIEQNRVRFGAWNVSVVHGKAPEALKDLPVPDAVFIGGTKGQMGPVLDVIKEKNENAKICISAIVVETLTAAINELEKRGWEAAVTQIQSSYGRKIGKMHMMMANNPIYIITGKHVQEEKEND
ncbi:MAG: precorrin-6y C5,15-methyltransferase (decarboxylating) subunit CbiE [Anaerovoracaceae bacterium]